jgi:hypothetical protein
LNARAVGAQSVLVASFSASVTRASLVERASARLVSRSANQARRPLSKVLRAWLKRVHRADSVVLSSLGPLRWCCFHSSSRARMRSPLVFHWVEPAGWAAIFSASATSASRVVIASARAAAR